MADMSTEYGRMVDALHKAEYVHCDEDRGVVYVWYGTHNVQVYAVPGWYCYEIFSAGSYADDSATLAQVQERIREWIVGDEVTGGE